MTKVTRELMLELVANGFTYGEVTVEPRILDDIVRELLEARRLLAAPMVIGEYVGGATPALVAAVQRLGEESCAIMPDMVEGEALDDIGALVGAERGPVPTVDPATEAVIRIRRSAAAYIEALAPVLRADFLARWCRECGEDVATCGCES